MRTLLAATALMLIAHANAAAQTAPLPPAAPKPVATTPVRPAASATPAANDKASAAAIADRTAIQSDLAWTSYYNGAITGEAGDRMTAAIKAFQKDNGGKQTGTLTPPERALLTAAAKKLQADVGWTILTDTATGARLGIPGKLVAAQPGTPNSARWTSSTNTIQIALARRKDATATIAAVAEQERKEPAGRQIGYSAVKPDFFVLSGMQGLKKFYVRGQIKDAEIRTLTILYDQATEGTMEPVVIAMSSAFTAFPTGAQVAAAPAPRKSVEYATGVIASADGAVLTDRIATDGCLSLVVAGYGNADRIAEDKTRDLALMRIYGARDLRPLGFGGNAQPAGIVTGIADPQSQGGGRAVSSTRVILAADASLTPAPALGFSGAPVRDESGSFAGIAILKAVQVAGPSPGAVQAVLVSADGVRAFLKANKVAFSEGSGGDAKASVVRVICVRKQ